MPQELGLTITMTSHESPSSSGPSSSGATRSQPAERVDSIAWDPQPMTGTGTSSNPTSGDAELDRMYNTIAGVMTSRPAAVRPSHQIHLHIDVHAQICTALDVWARQAPSSRVGERWVAVHFCSCRYIFVAMRNFRFLGFLGIFDFLGLN